MPEILQEQATADNLAKAVNERLEDEQLIHQLQETFLAIHQQLKCNADEQAAQAVVTLLEPNSSVLQARVDKH